MLRSYWEVRVMIIRKTCRNLSLYWDKCAFILYPEKEKEYEKGKKLDQEILGGMKAQENQLKKCLDLLEQRRKAVVEEMKEAIVFGFTMKLKGRLLVGSGNPSALEVGMTFSRNYGVPIIPGSALKGAFSNYIKEEPEKVKINEDLKFIFGQGDPTKEDDNTRGAIVFLDAIPQEAVSFELDIVNNHFQPYYMEESNPPNDWYNPVPVAYLVVSNTAFRFTALYNSMMTLPKDKFIKLKKSIEESFVDMLTLYGVGAKTNYGYGRFVKH